MLIIQKVHTVFRQCISYLLLCDKLPQNSMTYNNIYYLTVGQESGHGLPGSSILRFLPDCHRDVRWDYSHLLGMALLLSLLTSLLTGFNNFLPHEPLSNMAACLIRVCKLRRQQKLRMNKIKIIDQSSHLGNGISALSTFCW